MNNEDANKIESCLADVRYISDIGTDIVCPVCGFEASKREDIFISCLDDADNGTYCIRCYSKWIAKNFPKMIEKEKI